MPMQLCQHSSNQPTSVIESFCFLELDYDVTHVHVVISIDDMASAVGTSSSLRVDATLHIGKVSLPVCTNEEMNGVILPAPARETCVARDYL
jgi:hypothetical protein